MNKQAPAIYRPKKQESGARTPTSAEPSYAKASEAPASAGRQESAVIQPPKADPSKPQPKPGKPEAKPTGGEFKFEELKKGEIEINLD